MESFEKLMRYNDYENEPLSKCSSVGLKCNPDNNAAMAIASRSDLNKQDGEYNIPSLSGHMDEGATDAKLINKEYIEKLKIRSISSPPFENVAPFDWSTLPEISHLGLPDVFNFGWYSSIIELNMDGGVKLIN